MVFNHILGCKKCKILIYRYIEADNCTIVRKITEVGQIVIIGSVHSLGGLPVFQCWPWRS